MSEARLRSLCEKLVAETNQPVITTPTLSDVMRVWAVKIVRIRELIDLIDSELLHPE